MPSKPRYYGAATPRHQGTAYRESSAKRGYGRTWRKLRLLQLNREPLCELCRAEGRSVPGHDVDHIVPLNDGGEHELSNLQTLCKSCHSRKTAKDVRRRAAARGGDRGV